MVTTNRIGRGLPEGLEPPTRHQTFQELFLPFHMMRFAALSPTLLTGPRGDGRPVMLIPGYYNNELVFRPLQLYLRYLGYRVVDWGLGLNRARVDSDVAALRRNLPDLFNKPVTLIGWSLGGIVARELARLEPDAVREVITLSSPIVGGPRFTLSGRNQAVVERDGLDAIAADIHERARQGLSQPVTAIYSNRDGFIGPDTGRDIYNSHARNIRMDESHGGIGLSPRVWLTIANILAGKEPAA